MIEAVSSLHKLLRVREIKEQQQETILAKSLQQKNRCQESVERAHRVHLDIEQAFRQQLEGTINLGRTHELREQHTYGRGVVKEQKARLEVAEEDVSLRRQDMIEARRERRLVDKLNERSRERIAWQAQQQESSSLDEIGVQYYLRERR